ncbi:MAG: AI-2E family transporter [bacterium]
MSEERFRKAFLILLLLAISAAFVTMIRHFLLTILIAGIFSGLAHPLYQHILRLFRGRKHLASLATLVVLLAVVVLPLLTVLGLVAAEAFSVSESVRPWIQARLAEPSLLLPWVQAIPGIERLQPHGDEILRKGGEMVGKTGTFLFDSLSATTRGTAQFLFHFFVLLYTMFFFLMDGQALLRRILFYLPLPEEDESRMVDKFLSVTRATLKGTLLIGVAQGGLAGVAFAFAGIDGAMFWGTVMTVLSVVPGIGTAVVWVPAAVILVLRGHVVAGVGLALFCTLVVGSVDNVLRPRLVGRDTKMHELFIFFGTIGGILLFGALGFIVGPILAALFVTVWDMYGIAFRDVLPKTAGSPQDG